MAKKSRVQTEPVSLGGGDDPANLMVACQTCNRSKGSLTLGEWTL